ncbi:hypothetical protein [Marivita sp.]|uniref:hypothetical protein n=1 Tax=Marivita sp. TaxID=2003365 RepID=UPI0025BACD24|nr:hypothetical protein [Marivita sp.]
MASNRSGIADWCRDVVLDHDDIYEVGVRTQNSIVLIVKDLPAPIVVAVMSSDRVDLESVPDEFHEPVTEFLINIPKDPFVSGELLATASKIPLAVGGLADLYRAVNARNFRNYIPPEPRFLLRCLEQHTAVRAVIRANNRTYQVVKVSGDVVRVLALNDYDLTAEAVRSGIDKFGLPDFILASNPNCRLSSATKQVARSSGTGVLKLNQLMGALNN